MSKVTLLSTCAFLGSALFGLSGVAHAQVTSPQASSETVVEEDIIVVAAWLVVWVVCWAGCLAVGRVRANRSSNRLAAVGWRIFSVA